MRRRRVRPARAWWRTLPVAVGLLVGVGSLVLGAVPLTIGVAPAWAQDSGLAITGVQTSAGRVEFFLAARGLPEETTLKRATVRVRVGDTLLDSTLRTVASAGAAAPRRGVVLVLDASGSMAGQRISAARAAALDYAAAAPADVWLGLITVSTTPSAALAPTPDRAAFAAAVRRITAKGKTALYDGILAAEDMLDAAEGGSAGRRRTGRSSALRAAPGTVASSVGPAGEREFAERRVIVLSDGADSSSTADVEKLRQRLAGIDSTVDAVAYGEADRELLAGLTAVTGGQTLPAGDATALRRVFRKMASGLSPPVVVTATVPARLSGQTATLRVEVTGTGGTGVVGSAPVRFALDPRAVTPPSRFRVAGNGVDLLPFGAGAVALGLFFAVLFAVPSMARPTEAQRRLGELDRFSVGRRTAVTLPPASQWAAEGTSGQLLRAALAVSERAVRRPDRRERIELALDRAGSSLRAAEWQLIQIACLLAGALLGAVPLPWWAGAPLGALAGWLGSDRYLRARAVRRTRKFADQLPEALQLVVGSLRSGFSLPQSIDALVREGADPVASELGRALAETRLGGDLEDALERVGERNANQDMAWLVMAIRIQREVGGNLSETLETAVATMRERARLVQHVRTLSAEGRLSAWVLLGMPLVLGGWMFAFRRDYLRPLYTEPLGILMLVGAAVMVAVGALWLRKLVQVEV